MKIGLEVIMNGKTMSLNKSRYLEDQKIAEYYSDSKDKYINVDDMSETHCRRVIKKLIRDVVADILRDIWIKRSTWKNPK